MAIIDKPSDYFNTVLYTGNQTARNITMDFAPNWVWIKKRTGASGTSNHYLLDSVRGANKVLYSNATNAEETNTNSVTAFNSDGFSLGNDTDVNVNSGTFVSWNWKAGTSVSGNTGGSGTAKSYSGSVNTDAGFSIISYTGNFTNGQTTPHHLGAVPKMIIVKNYANASESWNVYHESIGNTKYLVLNTTAAADTAPRWNNTSPTSTVFTNGANGATNANNETIIAYCFAEKQGYSKFGSYVGSNSGAYGPFIYTGFKPAFVLIKDSSAANAWTIRDDKRNTYNPATNFLVPDSNAAEVTLGEAVDILSNGFKIKANGGKVQDSGNTYIYMAFAENPFVSSTGVPATAR